MCPAVKDYVITSHKSKEPGTRMLLEAIDIPVFLDCDMCLGEGTGAVAIFRYDLALSGLQRYRAPLRIMTSNSMYHRTKSNRKRNIR